MIRLGTRASALAMTQSQWVADQLSQQGVDVQLTPITTKGDRSRRPLALMGGVGVFAAALRTALLDGECDLAVHSMKDLPVAEVPGLTIAAVPPRENPADVLVLAPGLRYLPSRPRIGTGSPRRAAQLRNLYPDCQVADVRGNVPTRIARADAADLDAVVLAAAGIARLGDELADLLTTRRIVPLPIMPAAAQGALAVECRTEDATPDGELGRALAILDDAATRACVEAERAVLATLEAGCAAPVGTEAEWRGGELYVEAAVFALDGNAVVRAQHYAVCPLQPRPTTGRGSPAWQLGQRVAQELLEAGAASIADLGAQGARARTDALPALTPSAAGPLTGRTIVVPRPEDDQIVAAVRAAGASVIAHPVTRHTALTAPSAPPAGISLVALTSARTIDYLSQAGLLDAIGTCPVAAVGPATARAARGAGLNVVVESTHDAASLVRDIARLSPGHAWLPGSALAAPTLAEGLAAAGWQVTRTALYTTAPVESVDAEVASAWQRGLIDGVVVTAPSVAAAIVELLGHAGPGCAVVAIGNPSAQAVRSGGGILAATAPTPTPEGITAALIEALATPAPKGDH